MQQEPQFNITSAGLSDLEESVSDNQTTVENEYSKDNIDDASLQNVSVAHTSMDDVSSADDIHNAIKDSVRL